MKACNVLVVPKTILVGLVLVCAFAGLPAPSHAAALPGAGEDPDPTPQPIDETVLDALFPITLGETQSDTAALPAASVEHIQEAGTPGYISAGGYHTCLITSSGRIKCWGRNNFGQLGDNTLDNRSMPVDVQDSATIASIITAGNSHTCIIGSAGFPYCWGYNGYGQLGIDLGAYFSATPVGVNGLFNDVYTIKAGGYHSCARMDDHGVKCWGWNNYGQLGDNSATTSYIAHDVDGLTSGVDWIALGENHSCALLSGGSVKCWGRNAHGQLGDGTLQSRVTPVQVSGLTSGVAWIAAGAYHTCAYMVNGTVRCWGFNASGQLGDGTTTNRRTPVQVSGLSNTCDITAGRQHTCVETCSGTGVKCWGSNTYGQLGDGTTTNRPLPVNVSGLENGVLYLSAGNEHTCAVTNSGETKCWGLNAYGQLGDGTYVDKHSPASVVGFAAPLSPTPQYPNNTIYSTAPIFRWTQVAGATVYNLYVYTSTNVKVFSMPVTPTCDGTVCRYTPPFSLGLGAHKWAVKAKNDYASSATSNWLNFTVSVPQPPVLQNPAGTITTGNPSFTWNKSVGATKYNLYGYPAANVKIFGAPVTPTCGTITCLYTSSLGMASGNYKWAVKAGNDNGFSATSDWWNFNVQ